MFLQVKGSEKDYLEPNDKRDGEPGWWFAESDTYHFDHWLSFGLPYLLVLVDVKNQAPRSHASAFSSGAAVSRAKVTKSVPMSWLNFTGGAQPMSLKMTAALSSPFDPVFVVACTGVVMTPVHQVAPPRVARCDANTAFNSPLTGD